VPSSRVLPERPSVVATGDALSPRQPRGLEELAQSLRLSIARLARLLRQQDRTGHGATLTAALASVARHGGPTHGELAAIEQVAPPTITAVVGKMETLGLVTRETDPDDRRVTRIHPTPAGLDLLADTRNRRTEWLQMQMNSLTASELATLAAAADVLGKLTIAPESDAAVALVRP
jgi:DNA-binding MarR family transcriptional regulator